MKRLLPLSLFLLLAACNGGGDSQPPTIKLTAPANGATTSGVTTVQAETTGNVARVDAYIRASGSQDTWLNIGSASASPYQIGWTTLNFPNQISLDLYAEATSNGGQKAKTNPITVKINNSGTPTLNYLVAISYPNGNLSSTSLGNGHRPEIEPQLVQAPVGDLTPAVPLSQAKLTAQATRSNDLEWGWSPVSNADGYGVFLATTTAAGPYERQRSQQASGIGQQGFAVSVPGQVGDHYYGAVSTIQGSSESGLSNMDGAVILPEPALASPAEGQVVSDGRPILTWTPTAGAVGYLYYVYAQNPATGKPKAVWTNYPNTADTLTAMYPSDLEALKPGTYYWRVAAVAFDSRGKADSFSFSPVHTFKVP